MDTSHFIAQILGLIYVVVGIGILVDPNRYRKLVDELASNTLFLYYGGIAALVTGYLIITFGPNTWGLSPEGLITLIGWLALIKGVLLTIQPSIVLNTARMWTQNLQITSGIVIVLGLLLGYYGFM